MKLVKLPLYLICVSSFISCINTPSYMDSDYVTIELDLDTIKMRHIKQENFGNYHLIPLESQQECMVTSVDKMICTKEGFYIVDKTAVPTVWHFSLDGTFKNRIGRFGHSKSEYTHIDDITTSDNGDTIAILSYNNILFYDNNGTFIKTETLEDEYGWDAIMETQLGYLMGSYHRGYDGILTLYDKNFKNKRPIGETKSTLIKGAQSVKNLIQKNKRFITYFDPFASAFYIINASTMAIDKKIILVSDNMMSEEHFISGMRIDASKDRLLNYLLSDGILYCSIYYGGHVKQYEIDIEKNSLKDIQTSIGYDFEEKKDSFFYKIISPIELLNNTKLRPANPSTSFNLMRDAIGSLQDPPTEKDNYYIMRIVHR